jgi:hypothetical protein
MTDDCVTITVDVRCFDKRAVIKAARARARTEGNSPGVIRDWRDAVQWLIDPGHLPGCDVRGSERLP